MKYLRSFYKRHRGMAALALLLLLGQVVGTLLIPALIANVVDLGILPGDMDAILRTGGQMLAVARALMSRPKIIMMDEPSLGLAPLVVKGIFEIIQEINKQGVTVLLIEQNANMALHIADTAYVLETGRLTISGSGRELLSNEAVKKAYLG